MLREQQIQILYIQSLFSQHPRSSLKIDTIFRIIIPDSQNSSETRPRGLAEQQIQICICPFVVLPIPAVLSEIPQMICEITIPGSHNSSERRPRMLGEQQIQILYIQSLFSQHPRSSLTTIFRITILDSQNSSERRPRMLGEQQIQILYIQSLFSQHPRSSLKSSR